MEKLQLQLQALIDRFEQPDIFRAELANLRHVYPFSEYEYIISSLLALDKLALEEYIEMRNDYLDRNLYLPLFEISAPRGFGEVWAQGHLKDLIPELQRPSKKLDPEYSGQYDFLLPPGIRIEVKASRAAEFNVDAPLYIKALGSDSSKRFDMNFQQIKPGCCDVFVWIAVWRDAIRYWVLAAFEVEGNPFYSPGQHRGNQGEGQLHLNQKNINDFNRFLSTTRYLPEKIKDAHQRQIRHG